jgi:hypothetical protein
MAESPSPEPVTFTSLVLSLATTAAVHFGDLGDPETGERIPQNLEGARQMIDMLAMLQDKTKGNLTPQEATILERVLFELRMRFVEAERAAGAAGGPRIIVP